MCEDMLAGHICLFDMIPRIQWTPKKHWHMGKITLSNIYSFLVRGPGPKSGNFTKYPEGISTLQSFVLAPRSLKTATFWVIFPSQSSPDLQEACLRGDLGLVKRLIAANASVTRKKMGVGRWIHFLKLLKRWNCVKCDDNCGQLKKIRFFFS